MEKLQPWKVWFVGELVFTFSPTYITIHAELFPFVGKVSGYQLLLFYIFCITLGNHTHAFTNSNSHNMCFSAVWFYRHLSIVRLRLGWATITKKADILEMNLLNLALFHDYVWPHPFLICIVQAVSFHAVFAVILPLILGISSNVQALLSYPGVSICIWSKPHLIA